MQTRSCGYSVGVSSALASAFLDAQTGPVDCDPASLQTLLQTTIARAQQAHPSLGLDTEAFVRFLAGVVDPARGTITSIDALHTDDLYLVFGCLQDDRASVRTFVETHGPELDRGARKLAWTGLTDEEFRQIGLARLFTPSRDKPTRLALYTGQAPLRTWMRVVAGRLAVDMMRAARPEATLDPDRHAVLTSYGIGDGAREHRAVVQSAYEVAFGRLEDEDRRLLRHLLVHGLNTEDLGALLGVHRTTAARRLAKARQRLHELARDELAARVGAQQQTLDSIVADARSQLELSVERLLASRTP